MSAPEPSQSADPQGGARGAFEPNAPYAPTPENRPAALEHSPLAFTREAHSQMSFGERAALEGVLAQLRPALAIEIGTAEGGTLARLASHSGEVHAIDLTHEEIAIRVPANVTLHTGASAVLLPRLLAQLASSGRIVDFALVDGDHSFEGVAADLRALLSSPLTARSVMLVHDTMNEEVRAGVESVGIEDYEKVVYYEPDFVPGYLYKEGVARGSAWGGLGLIICEHARSSAYADSPRQWRYHEPYAALQAFRARLASPEGDDGEEPAAEAQAAELDQLRVRLSAAEAELVRQHEALAVAYGSRSWRLTAPVRALAERFRARRAKRL